MKKKWTKILCFMMVVVFTCSFALIGCTKEDDATDTDQSAGDETTVETDQPADDSADQSQTTEEPKTAVVSLSIQPVTLNPHLDTRVWIWYYTDPMMGYLTNLDETGSAIVPYLAESWTYSDDNMEVTFKLREDVYFHNGRQMTADDVVWTMEYVLDESVGNKSYATFSPYIDKVEKINDYEVKFTLKKAYAPLLMELAYVAILPFEEIDTMGESPVGCGPFKFVRWDKDQQIVMEKFDDYFAADEIKMDTLIMRTFSEYSAEFAAFLSGEIQVMTQLNNTDVPTIKAMSDQYHISASEGNKYYVNWNMASDIAQNKKLREAVKWAVDRTQVINSVFGGNSYETWGFASTSSWWYYDDMVWDTDVEKAKQLVTESGYDGREIDMITPNTAVEGPIGTVIAEQLVNIGLNIKLRTIESAAFMDEWNKGSYEISICGFGGKVDPTSQYYSFTTEDPNNMSGRYLYVNDEYTETVLEAIGTSDDEARKELLKQAMVLFNEDMFLNMIVSETTISAVSNDIEGYVYKTGGRPDYTHIYFK